jgi:hypothetical protein
LTNPQSNAILFFYGSFSTGPAGLAIIPMVNGIPYDNVIITTISKSVIESTTNVPADSEIFRSDMSTSGGFWRLETSHVPVTLGGEYSALLPLEKRDMIWEKAFLPDNGNVFRIIVSIFNDVRQSFT